MSFSLYNRLIHLVNKIFIDDSTTHLDSDDSGNMELTDTNTGTVTLSELSAGGDLADETFVVMSTTGDLANERQLAVGNSLTLTDGGAGSTATLEAIQDIRTSASPTFSDLTISGTTIPLILLQSTDASDPTFTLKTTNTAHQIDAYLDEDAVNDNLCIAGQTASVNTYVSIVAQAGEVARYSMFGGSSYSYIQHGAGDHLTIRNLTQDRNIILAVDDGTVDKTITWNASADKLEHSHGTFNFDDDNLVTTGTLGCGTITVVDGSSINLQEDITFTGATTENLIKMPDNLADALSIQEGTNKYLTFITTNDEEDIVFFKSVDILHTAVGADEHALEIDADAANFGDVKAIDIDYITGTIAMGQDEGIILINIDETLAGAGSDVFGLEVLATDGSASIHGLKVGPVVHPVHQDSGTFINPTFASNDTPTTDVSVMRDGLITPVEKTTAIFEADNDYIIIGADAAFQDLELIFTTGSSKDIKPTFWYSINGGSDNFTQFTPVDGTGGCRHTGVISWDASDLSNHVADDTTGKFDIKIIRTKGGSFTTPVLGYAKTATTVGYNWDKAGDVNIRNLIVSDTLTAGALSESNILETQVFS